MAFLSIDRLTVGYGAAPVLDGVSLSVARGAFVALLGSSGCGKTTLLRAVSGFVPVRQGRIVVDGRDVTAVPPERRNTAMVFQSYALWPHMTTARNMAYGLKLRGWSRDRAAARVEELLTLLKLEGLGGRNVTQLSGGQRQRVALGRALAVDPEILLLDEPLSNLDARIRLELRHEIRALQQRLGITAVHVTHDREEAMVMADRIVVLDAGRIAQEGTPEEVYHRPASAFVASFMGADNVVALDAAPEIAAPGITAPGAGVLDVAAGPDHDAVRLPLGEGGVHLPGGRGGRIHAHFRSEAARLADPGAPADGALCLRGRIVQASYPGGVWRYAVDAGGRRFLVDDAARRSPGDAVVIAIPPSALHAYPAAGAA
ncbi:ABC transporter ATP-binding protein [Azospirillum halopraeferens]|uniref:ABC transporter ATP-binding protein n=1 Tax=Azospirillum halopraeferens TaxID=34010 RepID=UPI000404FC0F|nr:ABC transporter ATP-binding protein [Azospirillum halopraeferens]